MNIVKLQRIILEVLEEHKAKDIINLDVRKLTTITDHMIICTGSSKRHVQTIVDYVITRIKAEGIKPIGIEGKEYGEWALIDLGEIVVHAMVPQVREFYSLEKLWSTTELARQNHED